jgi:hypothetical protein
LIALPINFIVWPGENCGKWYNENLGAAMKAKKAVKRLTRVEVLLSNIIEQYAGNEHRVKELLDSAKESVVRARETVNQQASANATKKPLAKEGKPLRQRLTAEGRKKLSLAAKKRWAVAKRKGISAVTGRPLSKTA